MFEHGHVAAVVVEEVCLGAHAYEFTVVSACIWSEFSDLLKANGELSDLFVLFIAFSLYLTHCFFQAFSQLSLLFEFFLKILDLIAITKGSLNIFEILLEPVTVHFLSFTIDFPQFFWS